MENGAGNGTMTEPQRVDYLIRNLENGSAVKFAEKVGIGPTILSRVRSGQLRLDKKIDAITKAYPYVSRDWLETGEGYPGDLNVEMTRERFLRICRRKDELIETLRREVEIQQRVIDRLTK